MTEEDVVEEEEDSDELTGAIVEEFCAEVSVC